MKKFITLLICMIMLLGVLPIQAAEADVKNPFVDVPLDESLKWALESKIKVEKGDSNHFAPNDACTRGEIIYFIWQAMGSPQPRENSNPFTDINGSPYYNAILWAYNCNLRITSGTTATKFSPDQPCTRAQVVTFLWTALGKPDIGTKSIPFKDVKSGKYYYKAVVWAYNHGVTSGTSDNTFSPDEKCTRKTAVLFLYKTFKSFITLSKGGYCLFYAPKNGLKVYKEVSEIGSTNVNNYISVGKDTACYAYGPITKDFMVISYTVGSTTKTGYIKTTDLFGNVTPIESFKAKGDSREYKLFKTESENDVFTDSYVEKNDNIYCMTKNNNYVQFIYEAKNKERAYKLAWAKRDVYERVIKNGLPLEEGNSTPKIVEIAKKEIGYKQYGKKYKLWYHGLSESQFNAYYEGEDWCAIFVSWCAKSNDACGYNNSVFKSFSWCGTGVLNFYDRGQWVSVLDYPGAARNNVVPEPGWIIFFDWNNNFDIRVREWDPVNEVGTDGANHVGIVSKVENGNVYYIDGNGADKNTVRETCRSIYDKRIIGYGKPNYPNN